MTLKNKGGVVGKSACDLRRDPPCHVRGFDASKSLRCSLDLDRDQTWILAGKQTDRHASVQADEQAQAVHAPTRSGKDNYHWIRLRNGCGLSASAAIQSRRS